MFTFQQFQKKDIPLLFKWLALPHVAEWWRETRDYKKFETKYSKRTDDESIGQFLICHKEKSIGYISWYNAKECPFRNETFPDPTYGFDILIADQNYFGKGYGDVVIKQFIDEKIMPMNPKKIIVDPEIANKKAIHVYQKVGFKKIKQVQTTDGTSLVDAQLMELDV